MSCVDGYELTEASICSRRHSQVEILRCINSVLRAMTVYGPDFARKRFIVPKGSNVVPVWVVILSSLRRK